MAHRWFVEHEGRPTGPLTANELRTRAADGRLSPSDRVSLDGRRWATAGKVKGLRFERDGALGATMPTIVLPDVVEPDAPSLTLPGYEVLAEIGSGGCGVVYRAKQLRLGRMVALKTVRLETAATGTTLARFELEAVALGKLQHPNIVGVFDYGHNGSQVFMAMELLDGEDLERRIKRLSRLDERTAVDDRPASRRRLGARG